MVLLYYSQRARERLEEALLGLNLDVYPIYGRAPDAIEGVRRHPAGVVIIDCSAEDVSVSQAARQIGQLLPESTVITVSPERKEVNIYFGGHRVGVDESLETAFREHIFSDV